MEDYISQVIKLTNFGQNRPLNEIVYEGIRNAIIKGFIPVGERINELEYSERMNISRTPIREALRRIGAEGLVEYIPHFGVVVKKVTIEDASEIYKIREALDILATTNAMMIMSDNEFAEMHELLERTSLANSNNDIAAVIKYFSEFNDLIYTFSRMPRLDSIVIKLREYLMRFRDISLGEEERRKKALDEHWNIYENMKNKDHEQISLIIVKHLEYSKEFIIEEIIRMETERERQGKTYPVLDL